MKKCLQKLLVIVFCIVFICFTLPSAAENVSVDEELLDELDNAFNRCSSFFSTFMFIHYAEGAVPWEDPENGYMYTPTVLSWSEFCSESQELLGGFMLQSFLQSAAVREKDGLVCLSEISADQFFRYTFSEFKGPIVIGTAVGGEGSIYRYVYFTLDDDKHFTLERWNRDSNGRLLLMNSGWFWWEDKPQLPDSVYFAENNFTLLSSAIDLVFRELSKPENGGYTPLCNGVSLELTAIENDGDTGIFRLTLPVYGQNGSIIGEKLLTVTLDRDENPEGYKVSYSEYNGSDASSENPDTADSDSMRLLFPLTAAVCLILSALIRHKTVILRNKR